MSVRDRVKRTQRVLELLFFLSALIWAAAFCIALYAIETHEWAAIFAAAVVMFALIWSNRFAWSFDRVALWIEERSPRLRYALVTAVDPRYAESFETTARTVVDGVALGPHVRRLAARTFWLPSITLGIAFLATVLAAGGEASATPSKGGARGAAPVVLSNRLVSLNATVTPPQYAGLSEMRLDEPSTISSLQGSRVLLEGLEGWSHAFTMTDTAPSLLTLEDRGYSRSVIIDPRIDRAPNLNLRLPARDTTIRTVTGNLHLAADLTDDIGLGRARFEFIISTGSQENFEFREGTLGARRLGRGRTSARLEISVPFASFKLNEGDRLSVRAVAWDNNTLYGPGKGTSETRTIRVATKHEYDSLAVNRAPPSADTALMSLRMLIIATEKLKAQKPKMQRRAFVDTARKLGTQSENIRRKIQQIIDETTGGGQIDPDTLLTTALGAMWDATRELFIASPATALPPMYVAYKALETLRNAKRYYIRGLQKPIIVNVERVRLAGGTDTGRATPRLARNADPSSLDQLRQTYAHAVRLLGDTTRGDSVMTLLMTMRVASLRAAPNVATALGDAIAAMQRGADATIPLVRTRRLLESTSIRLDSLPAWSGAWQE